MSGGRLQNVTGHVQVGINYRKLYWELMYERFQHDS
jgi:hypothetical protein